MSRTILALFLPVLLVWPVVPTFGQGPAEARVTNAAANQDARRDPLDLDQREEVQVRLVLIDAVVLDGDGRTVADLTREEFEVLVDGKRRPIDTLDLSCPGGATDDPRGVRDPRLRATPAPEAETKIALVLDYMHLDQLERVRVLEQARRMVLSGTGSEEFMVAALNGGVRIEQPFTADRAEVARALKRMEYDISLWEPTFEHLSEEPLYTGLEALFAVLERVPGSKSMVLYSSNGASAKQDDQRFADLAAAATSSRCSIYTVHAAGLFTPLSQSARPPWRPG